VHIAEPKALIGFAGPRVIEQTVRETLPEGFQRSEFLLEKGAIDMIVGRNDLREKIADLLAMLMHTPRPDSIDKEDEVVLQEEQKQDTEVQEEKEEVVEKVKTKLAASDSEKKK